MVRFYLKRFIKFILPYGVVKLIKIAKNNVTEFSYVKKRFDYKKIISVFAFYSSNGRIPKSDIYYINELSKFSNVIVVGDCGIIKREFRKIKKYVICANFITHKKYDFGSYFLGYKFAKEYVKEKFDLLLVNNSCIGPFSDLKRVIETMNERKIDFWGLNSSKDCKYHIQSYFYYFKFPILNNNYLYNFLKRVKVEKTKSDIIKNYELKLTEYLLSKGFKCSTYIPLYLKCFAEQNKHKRVYNKMTLPLFLIKKYDFPLVKRKIFIDRYGGFCHENISNLLKEIKLKNLFLYQCIIEEYNNSIVNLIKTPIKRKRRIL